MFWINEKSKVFTIQEANGTQLLCSVWKLLLRLHFCVNVYVFSREENPTGTVFPIREGFFYLMYLREEYGYVWSKFLECPLKPHAASSEKWKQASSHTKVKCCFWAVSFIVFAIKFLCKYFLSKYSCWAALIQVHSSLIHPVLLFGFHATFITLLAFVVFGFYDCLGHR